MNTRAYDRVIHNEGGLRSPRPLSTYLPTCLPTCLLPILLLLLFAGSLLGQGGRYAYYSQYQYTSTSGKCTLQLPTTATGWKVRLLDLYVTCPTYACTLTYTTGSGLATTTAGTRYRQRSDTPATSKATFFTASNATGGTAGPAIPFPVGYTPADMTDFDLRPGEALTITAASTSQTVTLVVRWEEYEGP